MSDSKDRMDSYGEGSSPSAPSLPVSFQEATTHPLSPPPQRQTTLSRDSQLVRDLLRKADGDIGKVTSWLEAMGESVATEDIQNELAKCEMKAHGDDIDAAAAQLGAPETYFCPISFHMFRDPVLLQTGQTYERGVIHRWLAEGGSICPITGIQLPQPVSLTPNVALRQAIEEWAQRNAQWMLGPNGRLLPVPEKEHLHYSIAPEQIPTNEDTALAIRLQREELAQQRRPRGRTQHRSHRTEMTQSQYERIRRCVFLLFLITVAHFAMFVITLSAGDWKFAKIDDNPLIGFGSRVLRRAGGTDTHLISEKNEWWRIATSALMTSGIIHLQWVVCCLWTCGRFLAARMSFLSLGLLYTTSCVCGVLLSANFSLLSDTAGASAGAFGLIGAVLVETVVHRKHYRHHFISLLFLATTSSVGVVMGTTPFVDNWTNLGGFISGVCLAMALRLTHRVLQGSAPYVEGIMVAIQVFWFFLVCSFVVLGCVGLFLDKESREKCVWCQRLTCINVDWWDCDIAVLPPDGYKPQCSFDIQGDLTTIIQCPSGVRQSIELTDVSHRNLDRHCEKLCLKPDSKTRGKNHSPSPPPNSVGGGAASSPSVTYTPSPSPTDDETKLQKGNVEQNKLE